MFNSIETLLNTLIEESTLTTFKITTDKGQLKDRDKDWVLRYGKFYSKLNDTLPQIFGSNNFHILYPEEFKKIEKVKLVRDNIMHFKLKAEDKLKGKRTYLKDALAFDYEGAIHTVKDFINFYKPETIEDCNCGKEL